MTPTRHSVTPSGRARPNPLGTVRKEPSGRFRASYRVDGRTFGAPATFATEKDAQAWLAGEHGARRAGTWLDPRRAQTTVSDYALAWLRTRTDLAVRTRDLYQDLLTRFILRRVEDDDGIRGMVLGDFDLGAVTPAVIRSWFGYLRATTRRTALAHRGGGRRVHPARAWARANGMSVPDTGRLSPAVVDAWVRAGSPAADPDRDWSIAEEARQHAGATSAAHAYQLVRTILRAAVDDGILASSPCTLKRATVVPRPERPVLTASEVGAVASCFPEDLRVAVFIAAWSGLRYGELFALARRHVDLDAGTVRVERALLVRSRHATMFGPTKTARSRRTVHLPAFVVDLLREHMDVFVPDDPDALLFATSSGRPVPGSRLSQLMAKARVAIDRPDVRWHDLRHTGSTFAYRVGASMREVMDRLGHSSVRAAMVYAHAAADGDELLARRLDEAHRVAAPDGPAPTSGVRPLAHLGGTA